VAIVVLSHLAHVHHRHVVTSPCLHVVTSPRRDQDISPNNTSSRRRLLSPQPGPVSRSLPGSPRRSPLRSASRSGRSCPSSPVRVTHSQYDFQEESAFQPDYEE